MRSIVVSVAILMISIVCCYFTYSYSLQFALWLGIAASFVLTVFGILQSHREPDRLLTLLAFTISMCIPSLFQTRPWGFIYPFNDSSLDLTLANLIRESGKWYPGMGFEVMKGYSLYPILHLWTALASNVTGLDTAVLARVFPFLAESLVTVFFYLALREILSRELAIWSALMYNLNGSWHFWEYFVREFIALVFFSMCLYVVFRIYKSRENRRTFLGLGVFMSFMTVSSHHWTSYNLVIIFFVLAVFPMVYRQIHAWLMCRRIHVKSMIPSDRQRIITPLFMLITVIIMFSWTLYIAYSLFAIHLGEFASFFANVITPSSSFVGHAMRGLAFELRLLLYLGYLVLGSLGLLEFVRQFFVRRQKSYEDAILESWFIFSGVYIFVGTFLLPSGGAWWVISWRSWVFAFFGLVPLAAKSIVRMQRWKPEARLTVRFKRLNNLKRLLPLILIFPLASAVLMAPPEIRVASYPHVDDSYYSTALWFRYNLPNETIALDSWSSSVIIPYGRVSIFESLKWPGGTTAFLDSVYQSANSSNVRPPTWKIVVFNRDISEWMPTVLPNSSTLDQRYNRVYDSGSLATYVITTHD